MSKCNECDGTGSVKDALGCDWLCMVCYGHGDTDRAYGVLTASDGTKLHQVDPEGRLIRAAGDVMRAQRIKGIRKYQQTLEDQHGYTLLGMIDMTAEELADGSVYIQKVREQHMALLAEIEAALDNTEHSFFERCRVVRAIINRERGNV